MIDWIERRQRNPSSGSGALLLDAYGGALNRPAADATAFVHRDMLFSLQYLAYFNGGPPAAPAGAGSTACGARCGRTSPARPTRTTSTRSSSTGSGRTTDPTSTRLREIKKQVDPDFRFRFPQAIPPAR